MICPHCSISVMYNWHSTPTVKVDEDNSVGTEIAYAICPSCSKIVISLRGGPLLNNYEIGALEWSKIVYPSKSSFIDSEDIPSIYKEDYDESLRVISASAKASAALSRRILQNILREEYKIIENSLSEEIKKFSELPGIPSYITDAIDAIRHVGNFAAHPIKDRSTGEIVPVENGEAEWLIEVIEALFDFAFIQPKKLIKRRGELNLKLQNAGKPPMKEKK